VRYAGKQVLVLGGTGFIGGRLVERLLLEEGARVRVLVREWSRAVWVSRTTAELVAGDVLDPKSVALAMKGCEIVFDCASGPATEGGYRRTNVEGTRNVIQACRDEGVHRCVYVSSIAAHGDEPPEVIDASTPVVRTGRDYGDSKAEAEILLREAFNRDRFPVVIVRPTYVWGPRSSLFTVRQLMDMKHHRFRYVDEGCGRCTAVYVDNLVDVLLLAGDRPLIEGKSFIITDGGNHTWNDFFGFYQRYLGLPRPPSICSSSAIDRVSCLLLDTLNGLVLRLQGQPAPLWRKVLRRSAHEAAKKLNRRFISRWDLSKYSRTGTVDGTAARELLGYIPSRDLATGMQETLEWVTDQYPDLKDSTSE